MEIASAQARRPRKIIERTPSWCLILEVKDTNQMSKDEKVERERLRFQGFEQFTQKIARRLATELRRIHFKAAKP